MANKSVHQVFNPDAVEHFVIDCDPYGIIVDNAGTIEKVYVDESNYTFNKIEKILGGAKDEPDMTLYKKGFLFPNSPISIDRVKAALKEHKITLTNDYEDADLFISHCDLVRSSSNGENVNTRSLLNKLWNFDAIEKGNSFIDKYCEDNSRNSESARVIYCNKAERSVNVYAIDRLSMPYDSWLLSGLAVNAAHLVDTNQIACYDVEKILHQSATKSELTEQMISDFTVQMGQGSDGIDLIGAILPTVDYTKKKHLLWKLSQEIGSSLYLFNRNKDVQYWIKASGIEDYYHHSALDMIQHLENNNDLTTEEFKYLEPIVRKEIKIDNRDLYTFRVEVKPEYKKLMT